MTLYLLKFPIKYNHFFHDIIVGIVYKPDYVDYEDFISQIELALDNITKEKKRGFIMGDFNIDLLKYNHNHQVSTFVNLMYFPFSRVLIGLLEFA